MKMSARRMKMFELKMKKMLASPNTGKDKGQHATVSKYPKTLILLSG
jgi:hypothetical protein